MSEELPSGTSAPPAPSTTITSAIVGEARIRRDDDVEVDRRSRGSSGELRGDRRRECKRIDVGERRGDVARGDERARVGGHRLALVESGGHGLHSDRPEARGGQPPQQRRGDDRLADAGVGAGDEDAAGHGVRAAAKPGRPAGATCAWAAAGVEASAGPKNVPRVRNV